MPAGRLGNHFDLVGLEAEKFSIFDEIIRVSIVPVVVDGVSYIVKQRRVFK
jgi:hypothetical protein